MFDSLHLSVALMLLITTTSAWRPCPELNPSLRFPCRCKVELIGPTFTLGAVAIDCDHVVFQGESPPIPQGTPIISYSQRYSGQQSLPVQTISTSRLPIRSLDFSHNVIKKLSDKQFVGVQDTLVVLRISDNLLGDSLNPIFSTAELHSLHNLKVLDLAGNKIKGIEEGLLKGCENLQELYLDRNSFSSVPSLSLNGPKALKTLSLTQNYITNLKSDQFAAQRSLERIDIRHNLITTIDGGAFQGLVQPKEILLSGNRLTTFNSDVFSGAGSLTKLDLSQNFISIFPNNALPSLENLKVLNLSSNMIQQLGASDLETLKGLQILDLSRNNIASVPPATFRDLKSLKYLDLSLNSLRTIEDDALEGLDSLQTLIIRDNNILLIPGSALGRLPRLANLYLDFNRVAALSSDILGSIQPVDIRYMSLSRNVIRELPAGSFQMFKNLIYLDLSGNALATISADTFSGLESSLKDLRLAQNRITGIGNIPLQLRELKFLDFSSNSIVDIPANAFSGVENLIFLNISNNHHLAPIPSTILHTLTKLRSLDLSNTGIKSLQVELFANSPDLEVIILRSNAIQEIGDGSFSNLKNISMIDLSHNNIMTIKSQAFINLMGIKRLLLKGNQLSAFKGEFFNTGTSLEELDISDNQLSYLFPSSFRIHPRLRRIVASNNKFTFFPSELIASLQYLEFIDLTGNLLKSIDELDYARLPRLRTLVMANNELEALSEMAFHNSSQLQTINLSNNKLERIGERTFEGLVRLELLNLEGNKLTELPETIFERSKLQSLENINLANNEFKIAPLKAIQKQYFYISSVNLSGNKIKVIPAEDSTMVNIKNLDLSFNPLTDETLSNILSEPKTVRNLNLAGTGLKRITAMETPFLQVLNLSHNEITEIPDSIFDRSTLLSDLDLSSNQLDDMTALSKIWPMLKSLQHLNLSNNSFELISQGDLDGLDMLQTLSINNLDSVTKIEKNAFKNLPNLSKLNAFNYPRLGYLDVQGIVELLPALEALDIEVKDAAVGSDQIQPSKHPRLSFLGLRGSRLRSISSGTLAGLKGKNLYIKLCNTSLSSLPPALLFPVPRSSILDIDITNSSITVLSPQLLSALEDRRDSLTLHGLDSNPIYCDCNARALRRWLPGSHMSQLKCAGPEHLEGKLLIEVGDDELTCGDVTNANRATTLLPRTQPALVQKSAPTKMLLRPTTTEPEIIWSLPPTQPPMKIKTKAPLMKQYPLTNDDTLIIGIVGGVVAFIVILIIIFCIVRLRINNNDYVSSNRAMPGMRMGPGSGQMSYKGGIPPAAALYAVPPYAQSYATLPSKGMTAQQQQQQQQLQQLPQIPQQMRTAYSTMGRGVPTYYQQQSANGQPYVIYSDDKSYR